MQPLVLLCPGLKSWVLSPTLVTSAFLVPSQRWCLAECFLTRCRHCAILCSLCQHLFYCFEILVSPFSHFSVGIVTSFTHHCQHFLSIFLSYSPCGLSLSSGIVSSFTHPCQHLSFFFLGTRCAFPHSLVHIVAIFYSSCQHLSTLFNDQLW